MQELGENPARILVPAALVIFFVVFVVVVSSSLSGSDSSSEGGSGSSKTTGSEREAGSSGGAEQASEETTNGDGGSGELPMDTYVVKQGDNFSTIAQATGVPADQLQELNPDLDPQALISGTKVKLRE